jgi:hypothetical protein
MIRVVHPGFADPDFSGSRIRDAGLSLSFISFHRQSENRNRFRTFYRLHIIRNYLLVKDFKYRNRVIREAF